MSRSTITVVRVPCIVDCSRDTLPMDGETKEVLFSNSTDMHKAEEEGVVLLVVAQRIQERNVP